MRVLKLIRFILVLFGIAPLCKTQSGLRRFGRRLSFTRCQPTTADIYGPYYRPGFPRLQRLCPRDAMRDRRNILIVSGYVMERNCRTAIPGARIEIWQADRRGEYEGSSQCRGYFRTNNNGFYRFSTVFPGKYQIPMEEAIMAARSSGRPVGDRWRPAHIHFKVEGRRGHNSLVSQMYFDGDMHLGNNDTCIICNSEHSDLVLRPRVRCRRNSCIHYVTFNIVLSRGNGISVQTL